ncbi:hypothetical protein [Methylobacterium nigriterrae]|uniref:hypothetical protein n=1 Tax=Methylobacterium nigriterrae TaxID=3127512 RepID=UPI003013A04C
MLFDARTNTDLLFASADERWKNEVKRRFGPTCVPISPTRTECRGEPGSFLRKTFDAREQAYRQWLRARGLGDFRLSTPAHRPEPIDYLALLKGPDAAMARPHWH